MFFFRGDESPVAGGYANIALWPFAGEVDAGP